MSNISPKVLDLLKEVFNRPLSYLQSKKENLDFKYVLAAEALLGGVLLFKAF